MKSKSHVRTSLCHSKHSQTRQSSDPRLRPGGVYRRYLCGAREFGAGADYRPCVGRPIDDDTDVENWPADAAGVQGPELMQRFLEHAQRFNTVMIHDQIHTASLNERPF